MTGAADLFDDADRFVAHRLTVFERSIRRVRPQVAAADAGAGDADDRVGRVDDGGVGDVLDTDVAGLVHDGCAHVISPQIAEISFVDAFNADGDRTGPIKN